MNNIKKTDNSSLLSLCALILYNILKIPLAYFRLSKIKYKLLKYKYLNKKNTIDLNFPHKYSK